MKDKFILISIDGLRSGELSLLDIAPTIADLLGIEPEEEWEGRSVANAAAE